MPPADQPAYDRRRVAIIHAVTALALATLLGLLATLTHLHPHLPAPVVTVATPGLVDYTIAAVVVAVVCAVVVMGGRRTGGAR
jgi:hypothetical protein